MATGSDPSARVLAEANQDLDILNRGDCSKVDTLRLNSIQAKSDSFNSNNSNSNSYVYKSQNVSGALDGLTEGSQIDVMSGRKQVMSRPDAVPGQKEVRKSIVIHGRRGGVGMANALTAESYRNGLDMSHMGTPDRGTGRNVNTEVRVNTSNIPRTPYPNANNSCNEMSANHMNTSIITLHSMARRNASANILNGSTDVKSESDMDSNSTESPSSTEPSSLNTSRSTGSSMSTSQTSGSLNTSQNSTSSLNTSNSDTSTGSGSSSDGTAQKAEQPLTFNDPRQRQVFEALTGIQNIRRSGDFSDVIVRVKDQEFRCHRFVLSNCSQFFRNLLNKVPNIKDGNEKDTGKDGYKPGAATDVDSTSQNIGKDKNCKDDGNDDDNNNISISNNDEDNNDESVDNTSNSIDPANTTGTASTAGNSVVVLEGVEPHIFEKVLDFIYCVFDGVISDNTALELLMAADTFKLPNLSQTCVTHIADTVSVDNVYDVISLVDSGCAGLTDHEVKLRCHLVFRENFLQLSCKNEFLGLGRTRMISLVADSMLVIKKEIDLIYPLIRWVEVRPSERCADLTLMLQLIRFPLMTTEDMDKLLDMPFLKENSLAKALIEESRTYSVNDFPDRVAWPRQNCISRCQFPSRDFILWTADRDKGLHLYSIIDGLHYKVTTFNEATMDKMGFTFDSTSTVCCYGDRLFFTGGEFKTDLAWSIDTGTGEVSVHSKMPRGRKAHSMVVSRGCVYCLGGQDKRGYTVLDSVDAYIISKDLWVKVGHMAVAAYNMTAVVSGGAIYMIGGVDHSGQPLRLVQCFAVLRSGLYSAFKIEISNMPPSLLSPRAVTSGLEGSIYIVCGHGEVYRLDVEKKYLQHINTLKSLNKNPRFRFGLAHVGGCLVVNGGHQLGRNKQEPVRSVCLDIATKAEVKDYSPLLPADIINTCFYAKLSSGFLGYSKLSNPGH